MSPFAVPADKSYREGPTLHDVTYDGRSIFYRLSLSEMHVPYADPRVSGHVATLAPHLAPSGHLASSINLTTDTSRHCTFDRCLTLATLGSVAQPTASRMVATALAR